jgi:GMP synthase-like glutamine amidotransferase
VTITIGILRADDIPVELNTDFGQYPQMIEDLIVSANLARKAEAKNLEFRVYAVNREEYPEDIHEVDGYIITGSKSSVYDPDPWIAKLQSFVATLHRNKKNTVGICFGHQIIASALGGKTEKAPIGWGLGVIATEMTDTAAIKSLGLQNGQSNINLLYSHQDQVTQPAPGSALLASTDICPAAIIAIDQHILSFQGHPEFSYDYARALYNLRRERYPEHTYKNAMASLEEQEHGALVANWIIDFLDN